MACWHAVVPALEWVAPVVRPAALRASRVVVDNPSQLRFQVFEGFDVTVSAQLPRQLRTYSGKGSEERLGGQFPAQPVELLPSTAGRHFRDRGRDAGPYRGQRDKSVAPLARQNCADWLRK